MRGEEMKRRRDVFLISAGILVLFLTFISLPAAFAALPDFNRLNILSISHSLDQGPQAEPDPFYPGYLSLFYEMRVEIRIERPPDWDSSLFEVPGKVESYIGRTILEFYQRDGQKREDLTSVRVTCELHPIWVTPSGEVTESPSRIGYFVPTFLLERGLKSQIGPSEMLDRGRAYLRGLLRKRRE
jgi:hypothetical protein